MNWTFDFHSSQISVDNHYSDHLGFEKGRVININRSRQGDAKVNVKTNKEYYMEGCYLKTIKTLKLCCIISKFIVQLWDAFVCTFSSNRGKNRCLFQQTGGVWRTWKNGEYVQTSILLTVV